MQYKAAMEKIFRSGSETGEAIPTTAANASSALESNENNQFVFMIQLILYGAVPVCWLLLASYMVSFSEAVALLYMPCLGVLAACLANAVPIGGGIVYVPAFMVNISLD